MVFGNNSALYGWDPTGGLILVARTGDLLEVAPGDLRRIDALTSLNALGSGGEDGRVTGLSDNGLLAFRAQFIDGSSGVFVAQIPTPGAASLLGLATLSAARRRR